MYMETEGEGVVYLVGAGPGEPGLITVRGRELLCRADVIVYDRLVNPVLLCEAHHAELIDVGKVPGSHRLPQGEINALLVQKAKEGKMVVRLKGGDPFVFGRGGEECATLAEAGIRFEVVPGVTSAIAAPAYAGIPVTERHVASSFAAVTGHEDPTKPESSINWEWLAKSVDTLVFLMGVKNLNLIVEKLLEYGRAPDTPVSVVQNGTLSSQRVVEGTLSDIVGLVEAAGIRPPAVTVVGEVVGLRDTLRWYDTASRPLLGKRVLNTRPAHQSRDLTMRLSELGAEVVEMPTIKIAPPADPAPIDDAIRRLEEFDWVILTSVNGVQFFFNRIFALGLDVRVLAGLQIGAIGPSTAEAMGDYGIVPDFIPLRYTSEGVASGIKTDDVSGRRVLLPRADIAPEDLVRSLEAKGAAVTSVVAYTNLVPPADPAVLDSLRRGEVDVVTLTSGSTATNLASMLAEAGAEGALEGCVVACIGHVTAEVAKAAGFRVDVVAQTHTVEGLVDAIRSYLHLQGR